MLPAITLAWFFGPAALADDNIANCEIVVQQAIAADALPEYPADKNGVQIATFLPAADFIFSVFDSEKGHMTEIDGKPIRAVMCIRASVIPTEFDLKIIRTGLPFYISPNFDAKDSAFMAINSTDKGYVYDYVGPDLTEDDTELLTLRMALYNQQEDEKEEDKGESKDED